MKILLQQYKKNPYVDTSSNVIISFEENNKEKLLDRTNENFQLIKDEQISIAEKKLKEILGGKTISNSIYNDPINKKSIHEFKMDNQIGFMNKNSDDFENYRLLQISIAEDVRDNNWKENRWESNPYQNNESSLPDKSHTVATDAIHIVATDAIHTVATNAIHIVATDKSHTVTTDAIHIVATDFLPNQILNTSLKDIHSDENEILNIDSGKRTSEEFKNLIAAQVSLAENIRNEMPEFRTANDSNPYLNENIDESLDKTNKNDITTNLTDQTSELDFSILTRESKQFEIVKAIQIEIAQDTLNEMLLLSNSDIDDVEIIDSTIVNKKINNYNSDDQGFEFFKNKQIEIAEKKLMEILGQKNIHNSDYLDSENS